MQDFWLVFTSQARHIYSTVNSSTTTEALHQHHTQKIHYFYYFFIFVSNLTFSLCTLQHIPFVSPTIDLKLFPFQS